MTKLRIFSVLYTNIQISGGGGSVYEDYDKVNLNENMDFLAYYPRFKCLSLADNQLTSLDLFLASGIWNRLYISNNYIADIKPLTVLEKLSLLKCKGNPFGKLPGSQ